MPVTRRKYQALICVVSILTVLFIDQWLKRIVYSRFALGESAPIIKNILHITFISNTGAAFGLFKDSSLVFIVITMAAILIIAALIIRSIIKGEFLSRPVFNSGLIFIVSGALGNLIDRLKLGYVIDFIDVRIWPIFNIADTSITLGTFLLALSFIYPKAR